MSADFTPDKEDLKLIPPFKMQVLTNFPYIEADFDALTNYQLLCKVVEYLNVVIHNENEVTEEVLGLYNAYVALQNYVNDYFDNLDLQPIIDNKLDEMAEDGTLADMIAEYIKMQGLLVYNSVAEMKTAENIQNGSFLKTFGYYGYNNGGGAYYKARTITNEDVIDDVTIIALHDVTLVAELITNEVNLLVFGCYGDGEHDDTDKFNNALDYARSKKYNVVSSKDSKYLISDTLDMSNLNINLNNAEIIANDEIDVITINSNVLYGYIQNININCNNKATSAINVAEARNHIFNNINIFNLTNTGIKYTLGYENMFSYLTIRASDGYNTTVGINAVGADSHFNHIIILNCYKGIIVSAENWFLNIHGWITPANTTILYQSRLIETTDGDVHLSQVYSDNYHYMFYISNNNARIYGNQIECRVVYSSMTAADLNNETNVLIYQTANNLNSLNISLKQVVCNGYYINEKYTKLSNEKFYGNISFDYKPDVDISAVEYEITKNNPDNDNNITYTKNKIINLGDKIELYLVGSIDLDNYVGSKSSIILGNIPQYLAPSIAPFNYMLGVSSGEWDEDLVMKYMYFPSNRNITTNLYSMSGTKWFKIHMVYNR